MEFGEGALEDLGITTAFRGRRVLVTGHTGFKGSWLAIWLDLLGARVSGFSLDPPTEPSNYVLSRVGSLLVHDLRGDIRDAESIAAAIRLVQPEIVFHLAAQPLVRQSHEDPAYTFDVNVMGTVQVLEAIRRLAGPCVVVAATSDKCYHNGEQVWGFRECDPLGGGDPYSASKGAAEIAIASWRQSFFLAPLPNGTRVKLASVRAGNVIGGGDWAVDRIVPDCFRALSAGNPVVVRNPAAVRPWQHVLEPLSGYLQLAARLLNGGSDATLESAWNFGPLPHSTVSVRRLVDLILAAWNAEQNHPDAATWVDASGGHRVGEARVLRLSIEKALTCLHWSPRWDIGRTVERTVSWYRHSLIAGANMRAKCLEDIEAYTSSPAEHLHD